MSDIEHLPLYDQMDTPASPTDAINQIIARERDGDALRQRLSDYHTIYGGDNFARSLYNHASLIAESESLFWINNPTPNSAYAAFYDGAILGMRATLDCLPPDQQEIIRNTSFLNAPDDIQGESDESFRNRCLGRVYEDLGETAKQFHRLSESQQMSLLTAAEYIYEYGCKTDKDRFMLGAIFAMRTALYALIDETKN